MTGKMSVWSGIGVVVLTIFLIECVYRLAFWFWMEAQPHASVEISHHVRTWMTAAVMAGLLWMYLIWRGFAGDKDQKKRKP